MIKTLIKSSESLALAKNELEILKSLPFNENIVRFYDGVIITFEDRMTHMGLFLFELCSEGSLFDYILKRKEKPLEESLVIEILSQIVK